ncbi:unnamed protein product, partial [Ceratitis capitata]
MATVIIRDVYMDDLLTGSFSLNNVFKLQADVTKVLSSGGFELRKWATNCKLREKVSHASKQISHFLADSVEVRTLVAVNLTSLPTILTNR